MALCYNDPVLTLALIPVKIAPLKDWEKPGYHAWLAQLPKDWMADHILQTGSRNPLRDALSAYRSGETPEQFRVN